MRELRLGGNRFYASLPSPLCRVTRLPGVPECHTVLCPLETYSKMGHATVDDPCVPCPEGTTTLYMGSSTCEPYTPEAFLTSFRYVLGGKSHGWGKGDDACEWYGVKCDDGGKIVSLSFPTNGGW